MAKKDTEEITYILRLKKEAEDATSERREAAYELWELYQGRQDYSSKKDWQRQIFVPKIFMAIEQATSVVKRAIMSPRRLFKIDVIDPNDEEAKAVMKETEDELKRALRESNFAASYAETIKEAFLIGLGNSKVLWEGGLRYGNTATTQSYIDPNYQVGPGNSPKFFIEEKD